MDGILIIAICIGGVIGAYILYRLLKGIHRTGGRIWRNKLSIGIVLITLTSLYFGIAGIVTVSTDSAVWPFHK